MKLGRLLCEKQVNNFLAHNAWRTLNFLKEWAMLVYLNLSWLFRMELAGLRPQQGLVNW